MLDTTTIAPHLPHLRRFARAVTGSQHSGDAYAIAALDTLIADEAALPTGVSPRVVLYKYFVQLLNSIEFNLDATEADADTPTLRAAEQRLAAMTPLARQAFLLFAVEAFGVPEIAEIIGISQAEVMTLLDQAGQEVAREIACNVLIIEDEPLIALNLERIVTALGHRVGRVARTHKQAVAAVRDDRPGLVLADIELADGSSGVEAVNEIVATFEVPVIFVTAYPEQLLTGDRPEPTYLITKPFQQDALKAVISQALFFDTKAHPRAAIATGG